MVFDILYMVQFQPIVTLTFTRNVPSIPSQSVSRCLLQCYTFLMEHYACLLCNSRPVNRAALSNHYISVFTLLKVNSFVSFPSLLSSSSVEQILVVERLLFKFLHIQFPKPILFQFHSDFMFSSCSVIDQFKREPSIATVFYPFHSHIVTISG